MPSRIRVATGRHGPANVLAEHAEFVNHFARRGIVTLGGPLGDSAEVLLILAPPDQQSARAALQPDPWHVVGLTATVRMRRWTILLRRPYLREQKIDLGDKRIEPLQAQGKTVVFVLVDGKLKGALALADIVRPEAKQAIDALKAQGIRCLMLTGDNKATAK